MQIPNHSLDRDLMYTLSFRAHDLEANRAGRLTERQCRVQHVQHTNVTNRFWSSVVFSALASVILLSDTDRNESVAVALTMAVFVLILTVTVWKWSNIRTDLRERRVLSISGHVSLDIQPRRYSASYYMTIQDTRFEIDKETMLAFRNDELYTIYFTPRAEMVVAAEPLYT